MRFRRSFLHAEFVCIAGILAIVSVSRAAPIWFDETGGDRGYDTFDSLRNAYEGFLGTPQDVITFADLDEGTLLSDQFAADFGVTFENAGSGRGRHASGVYPEGGWYVENLTGYDGSYMPDGDAVYAKFNNNVEEEPFTILFDDPVSTVGAFLGVGMQGPEHSLQIRVYDEAGQLLGRRTSMSWLWEDKKSKQNHETFFAVVVDEPTIGRVEILNLAKASFADSLIIDNVAWSGSGLGVGRIPEPATVLLSAIGVMYLWGRSRRYR